MSHSEPSYRIFSIADNALVIDFGNVIDITIHKKVIALYSYLRQKMPEGIIETAPAYSSLYVCYDTVLLRKKKPYLSAFEQVKHQLVKIIFNGVSEEYSESRVVKIPVCYDKEFGIDVENIASKKNITPDELIEIHYSAIYRVFMIGFLPGFPYLGEVHDRIAISRHSRPRKKIEGGSVGIAGKQTGIYPLASPGGWQIIGRTPLKLFNPPDYNNENPVESSAQLTLLQPGDKVKFYPINKKEFFEIENEFNPHIIQQQQAANKSPGGIRIQKTGMFDTIQDSGRRGYQHLGINPGGAMDTFSLKVANILAGNDADTPAIELFFPASEIFFEEDALIAVAGANFNPMINGKATDTGRPVFIKKGSVIRFAKNVSGNCCYLAVHGGFKIQKWLGSYSTNIKAAAGGFYGRALKKEDIVSLNHSLKPLEDSENSFMETSWKAALRSDAESETVYIIAGKEWELLTEDSKAALEKEMFTISSNADKMGYRLSGNNLSCISNEEVVSSAVSYGTIQLLPDGQLIVLMADHQTTGGYPRIAHVITAHHSKLAQKRPGDKIRFQITDIKSAEDLSVQQNDYLHQLQIACKLKLASYL